MVDLVVALAVAFALAFVTAGPRPRRAVEEKAKKGR